jgi:hypothetical protein
MSRGGWIACAIIALLFSVSPAVAYCSEPDTPSRPYLDKPRPPDKPFCYNEYSNTHTCSDWEIDSYNNEVETFNRRMRQYQSDVEDYIRSLTNYVEEVVSYAKCEARDIELQ